jgi:phosphoribosylformylglycinamidine synthase PurS subunit
MPFSPNLKSGEKRRAWYNRRVKAHVWVMLKGTVLDPQGKAIEKALVSLGHSEVRDVRQGKFFVMDLHGATRESATKQVERIARDVLSNPVIEEFRFEIVE